MTLAKVEYEFFDFEEVSIEATNLHRQVRLHFSDAPLLFASWTWERQRTPEDLPYSIGYGPSSYFRDEPAVVLDASRSNLWAKHVGHEVALTFTPADDREFECQVLEVRSDGGVSFLWSFGRDVVGLSDSPPTPSGALGSFGRET